MSGPEPTFRGHCPRMSPPLSCPKHVGRQWNVEKVSHLYEAFFFISSTVSRDMDERLTEFVKSALDQLGGRSRFIAGAALALATRRLATEAGVDMTILLQSAGIKFGDLVRSIAEKDSSVQLQPQKGSDFLIGFDSAQLQPPHSAPGKIRKDFYDAFTLLDRPQRYYYPERDEITSAAVDGCIPIPLPLKEQAIALRREFAKELEPGDIQDELIEALDANNELSEYSRVLMKFDLSESWRIFTSQHLHASITAWATNNSLKISREWFNRDLVPRSRSAVRSLRDVFSSLSEEELEQVLVPAKLFAAILASRTKL